MGGAGAWIVWLISGDTLPRRGSLQDRRVHHAQFVPLLRRRTGDTLGSRAGEHLLRPRMTCASDASASRGTAIEERTLSGRTLTGQQPWAGCGSLLHPAVVRCKLTPGSIHRFLSSAEET